MSQPLLILKNLGCVRGGRRLFQGLNLSLHAGQCVEVHGPNGSGKSTLLRLVAGLFPDYQGSVEAAVCFYLGHRPAVSALLSPRENLEWYEWAAGSGGTSALSPSRLGVRDALAAVGLTAYSEIPCGQLSQGQQRRVGLARALIGGERLWLLDEPLTALDTQGRGLVGRFVAEHCAAGGAALCATHQTLGGADVSTIVLGEEGMAEGALGESTHPGKGAHPGEGAHPGKGEHPGQGTHPGEGTHSGKGAHPGEGLYRCS